MIIISLMLLFSCSQPISSRSETLRAWLEEYAESTGQKNDDLNGFENIKVLSSDKDSLDIEFSVEHTVNGELLTFPPQHFYFNIDGSINDAKVRASL